MCVERAFSLVPGTASAGVVRFSRSPHSRRSLCSIYNDYVNLDVFAKQRSEYRPRILSADRHVPLHSSVVGAHITSKKQLMVRCLGSWCEISVNYLMGFSAAGVRRSSFDIHFIKQ